MASPFVDVLQRQYARDAVARSRAARRANTGSGSNERYSNWSGDYQVRGNNAQGFATAPSAADDAIKASIAKNGTPLDRIRGRYASPIEAGTISGNRVQILGPKLVRQFTPSGGSMTFSVDNAHNYVSSHPEFSAHPDYHGDPAVADAYKTGYGKPNEPQPTLVNDRSGQYVAQGGVNVPVEQSTPDQRTQLGIGSPLQKIADFWNSPASLAARNVGNNAIAAVKNFFTPSADRTAYLPPETGEPSTAPIGASNGQAARVQTPTAATPIPKTETSPATDINSGKMATAPTPNPAVTPAPAQSPAPKPFVERQPDNDIYAGF